MTNKTALLHSFMDNIGGAEMVTLILARELNADLYTTNIDLDKVIKMGFEDVIPRIKSIGKVPIKAPFRHQMVLWKFRKLNLAKKYDQYIISGDWAMSAAVNHHPNIWYVHSPLNEIWQWKNYVRKNLLRAWQRPVFDVWVILNRFLTKKYSKKVDNWVCNSMNVQNRIQKFYDEEAVIINPPVYVSKHKDAGKRDFWLSVNRLQKHKRIELQIDAFKELPNEKLIIVGSYEKGASQFEDYKNKIEGKKPLNVKILNWVSDEDLVDLYSKCKGFITTSRDEDFGMNVVEAMASNKPIVAPNEGGYKESIVNNKNGILINDISCEKIIEAIKYIEQNPDIGNDNREYSRKFDTENFVSKISKLI